MLGPEGKVIQGSASTSGDELAKPTWKSDREVIISYLARAKEEEEDKLPLSLNRFLETKGMDFGGHEMIMTSLLVDGNRFLF